jgi:hypothetical protein
MVLEGIFLSCREWMKKRGDTMFGFFKKKQFKSVEAENESQNNHFPIRNVNHFFNMPRNFKEYNEVLVEAYWEYSIDDGDDLPGVNVGVRMFADGISVGDIRLNEYGTGGLLSKTANDRVKNEMEITIAVANYIFNSHFSDYVTAFPTLFKKKVVCQTQIYGLQVPDDFLNNCKPVSDHYRTMIEFEEDEDRLLVQKNLDPKFPYDEKQRELYLKIETYHETRSTIIQKEK